MYKAVCSTGELGNGRVKKRGTGTAYSSPSAARTAIDRYKGPEVFEVLPAGPIGSDGGLIEVVAETPKKHGGARVRSGTQMPSGQKAVPLTTTIDPVDKATLIAFGGGKIAIGLRRAAELVRETTKKK